MSQGNAVKGDRVMRKILPSLILILLVISGCAWSSQSYYVGLTPQSGEEAMAYYKSGRDFAQQGMHRDAIDQFRRAVALDPFFSEAYLSLSRSYYAIDSQDFALFYNIKYYEAEVARQYVYGYELVVY